MADAPDDALRGVLDAVVAIASDLDISAVLDRIIDVAVRLTDARYGALAVVGPAGAVVDFRYVGIDPETVARIGPLPRGHGILGLLIGDPRPIRLRNIAEHPASYGFPPHHPPMTTFLGVPIRVRDTVFGNLYLTEKQGGGEFTARDESLVLAVAAAAGVAIQNARLYAETRRRERWLLASNEVTTSLLSGRDTEHVLGLVAEHAQELADADIVGVVLPDPTGSLSFEVVAGAHAELVRGAIVPGAGSLCGAVFSSGEPIVLPDIHEDPRASGPLAQLSDTGPALFVPLGQEQRKVGTLALARLRRRPPFRETDENVVTAFAGQAALALQMARAQRDAQRLLVYEDRDRIARDLHDQVIQRLFATGMRLEGAQRLVSDAGIAERLRNAVDELDTTIREIRTTIFELHEPEEVRSAGVRSEVIRVVDEVTAASGVEPSVRIDGPVDTVVDAEAARHLFSVLREALSNVVRHAAATRVEVTVGVADDRLHLAVVDDGTGFADPQRRSGLENIERRAAELGGAASVQSTPGAGTYVRWSVPLG